MVFIVFARVLEIDPQDALLGVLDDFEVVDEPLPQEHLGERVGVTRQTIIAIERGNYTPSVLLALKLATVFSVSVETLFSITYE